MSRHYESPSGLRDFVHHGGYKMFDHVVDALVTAGTDEPDVEGATEVPFKNRRAASHRLRVQRGHTIPQVRVTRVSDYSGATRFDLSIPVGGLLYRPVPERLP